MANVNDAASRNARTAELQAFADKKNQIGNPPYIVVGIFSDELPAAALARAGLTPDDADLVLFTYWNTRGPAP